MAATPGLDQQSHCLMRIHPRLWLVFRCGMPLERIKLCLALSGSSGRDVKQQFNPFITHGRNYIAVFLAIRTTYTLTSILVFRHHQIKSARGQGVPVYRKLIFDAPALAHLRWILYYCAFSITWSV